MGNDQSGCSSGASNVSSLSGVASRTPVAKSTTQNSFGTAFAKAHRELGAGKSFTYNGKQYSTNRRDGRDLRLEASSRISSSSNCAKVSNSSNYTSHSNFSSIADKIFQHEGGLSNHRLDRGGRTNFGVTQKTYDAYNKERKISGHIDVSKITKKQASEIYKNEYFDKVKGSQLPKDVALVVTDYAVHSGPSRSIKSLQKVLGVPQDGIIGQKTLNALKKTSPLEVASKVNEERRAYLKRIIKKDPTQKAFEKGWNNRIDSLDKELKGKQNKL